jgi:hypothetical protein
MNPLTHPRELPVESRVVWVYVQQRISLRYNLEQMAKPFELSLLAGRFLVPVPETGILFFRIEIVQLVSTVTCVLIAPMLPSVQSNGKPRIQNQQSRFHFRFFAENSLFRQRGVFSNFFIHGVAM